jgi:hypothetical protein
MQFKTSREQSDFGQLAVENMMLKRLIVCLDNYSVAELGKEITITSIHRTEEENKACNAATEIHVIWHAADVSIKDLKDWEKKRLLDFCNNNFTYRGTAGHPVALIHAVPGGVSHLHLQYL